MFPNNPRKLCIAIALLTSSSVHAQMTPTSSEATIENIVVTGTRATNRTAFDTAAPVDVFSAEDIEATVSSELVDSLAQLLPSFNVQRLPLADGNIFVRPARLRSLSPDQTLVLVNGKRRHRTAHIGRRGTQPADLAQIPSFAISRVEVLRDGASAQYGSDAIAGVINLILHDEPGISTFVQGSQYYEGDGQQFQAGLRAGFNLADRGSAVLTLEYTDADLTSRSIQRPDAIAFQDANPEINVRDPVQRWGKPEREVVRLAGNMRYDIGESLEGYAFGTFGRGEGVSDFNWRNPATVSAFRTSELDPDYDLNQIYPAGFTPRFGQEDEDYALVGGVRGELNPRLSWDISGSFGRNEIDYFIRETINPSLGSASPTSFRPGVLSQQEANLNIDFLSSMSFAGLHDDVYIAFGAERRKETFKIRAGDRASFEVGPLAAEGLPSGSNGFPGYSDLQAGSFSQTSYAGYIDVEAQVSEALSLGAALRHEDFSEFGSSTDFKLSSRYAFTPDFALRATYSTGFRAPTPGQLESERTSQGLDSSTLTLVTNGRFNPTGPVADIINDRPDGRIILPLEAETSENISVGLVYRTSNGLVATVDVYQINVDDRFSSRGGLQLTDDDRSALQELGIPGGESIRNVSFFQNVFDTRTRGIDIVLSYGTTLGDGRLNLNAAYNYNETKVRREQIAGVFNDVSRRTFEEGLPQHNATAAAEYSFGRWSVLGRLRYYGSWLSTDDSADVIFQNFSSEYFVDAAVSYDFTNNVNVRLGAENIFNTFPDKARRAANRGLLYSRDSPYDTDGGKFYLRLSASL